MKNVDRVVAQYAVAPFYRQRLRARPTLDRSPAIGRREFQAAMFSMAVVMVDEHGQDSLKMLGAATQKLVRTTSAPRQRHHARLQTSLAPTAYGPRRPFTPVWVLICCGTRLRMADRRSITLKDRKPFAEEKASDKRAKLVAQLPDDVATTVDAGRHHPNGRASRRRI